MDNMLHTYLFNISFILVGLSVKFVLNCLSIVKLLNIQGKHFWEDSFKERSYQNKIVACILLGFSILFFKKHKLGLIFAKGKNRHGKVILASYFAWPKRKILISKIVVSYFISEEANLQETTSVY